MTTRFVKTKTTKLYESASENKRMMVLFYGDEVDVVGPIVNGRSPVLYRGKQGFVKDDHLNEQSSLELYFIDVGQGDSTFIVTPGRKKILIDGGINRRALGFLAWKYWLDKPENSVDIDLLVLTHADTDHLNGLVPIVSHPQINVKKVIHSGIATLKDSTTGLGELDPTEEWLTTFHSGLTDLEGLNLSDDFERWKRVLVDENVAYSAVDTADSDIEVGDPKISLEILGPRKDKLNGDPVFKWFKNKSHTINGHSVVLRLTCDDVSILLTGDLNIDGAKHLMQDSILASKMDAHVLKAPHHGSHEYYAPLLQAVRPQISVISSGDDPDHGHPRAVFIGGVGLASRSSEPLIFSTEIAATFVEVGENEILSGNENLEGEDFATTDANKKARKLFKRRLHGMINVRTDGRNIYAARRVAAGYWWESYGPLKPAPR